MDYNTLSVKELEKLVDENDAEAIYQLAFRYDCGEDGLELSQEKAYELHKKGAELGHAPSQNDLALCYSEGLGVEQDDEKGFYWYEQAAKNGSKHGMHGLSICYFYRREFEKAFYWAEKSAKLDYIYANYILGGMYENGTGTEVNLDKAIQCYKNVHEDDAPAAFYSLACIYERQGNQEEANKWIEKAADKGNTEAMVYLASMYDKGVGVVQSDKLAFAWVEKSAQANNLIGQRLLGGKYYHGTGVEQDHQQARYWFEKAAKQGDVVACKSLYDMLKEDNLNEAVVWLEKGAEGDVDLCFELGQVYCDLNSSLRDYPKAIEWTKKAYELDPERMRIVLLHMLRFYGNAMLQATGSGSSAIKFLKEADTFIQEWHESGMDTEECKKVYAWNEEDLGYSCLADDQKEKAFEHFTNAWNNGRGTSDCLFGIARSTNLDIEENFIKFYKYIEKAVKLDNWIEPDREDICLYGYAQFLADDDLQRALGGKKDIEMSYHYMKKSAELGYEKAQKELSRYSKGLFGKLIYK